MSETTTATADAGCKPGNVASLVNRLSKELQTKQAGAGEPNLRKGAAEVRNRRALVVFSYTPENEDELRLETGDTIDIIGEEEEGWWKGRVNGKVGVFPSNFVKIMEGNSKGSLDRVRSDDEKEKDKVKPEGVEREGGEIAPKKIQGIGFGNIFQGQQKIELKSRAGSGSDGIRKTTIEPVAQRHSKTPPTSSTVAATDATGNKIDSHATKDKHRFHEGKEKEYAKVQYDYEPENEDELKLEVGDTVTVLSRECEDPGWWYGEIRGKKGVFPDNFVKLVPAPAEVLDSSHKTTGTSGAMTSAAGSTGSTGASTTTHTPPVVPVKPKPPSFGAATTMSPLLPPSSHTTTTIAAEPAAATTKSQLYHKTSGGGDSSAASSTSSVGAKAASLDHGKDTVPEKKADRPGTPDRSISAPTSTAVPTAGATKNRVGYGLPMPGLAKPPTFGTKSPPPQEEKETNGSDNAEGDKLSHITSSRPRNPNKRPPSQVFLHSLNKEASPIGEEPATTTTSMPPSGTVVTSGKGAVTAMNHAGGDVHGSTHVSREEYDRMKHDFEKYKVETDRRIKDLEKQLEKLALEKL